MSIHEFVQELKGNRVEGELVKTVFYSLLTSCITLALLYWVKLQYIENVIPRYGFFIFLAVLSYALMMPSIRQVRAFKHFPCMTGMMIGMTIGMMAGFLSGFYVGATNGMFWGSVFGIIIGVIFGVWKGKCCGIMGVMEGMMAGFMGGLMGAMTAIMMYNDNLKAAGVLVFLVCGAILIGLSYMLYLETKKEERIYEEDYFLTMALSFFLTALTVCIMVFGPRSVLFQ